MGTVCTVSDKLIGGCVGGEPGTLALSYYLSTLLSTLLITSLQRYGSATSGKPCWSAGKAMSRRSGFSAKSGTAIRKAIVKCDTGKLENHILHPASLLNF